MSKNYLIIKNGCATSWGWTFVNIMKSRCLFWSEQTSWDSLYSTRQFCEKFGNFWADGALWQYISLLPAVINSCFISISLNGSFVWSWEGKVRYLLHTCRYISWSSLFCNRLTAKKGEPQRACLQETALIIFNYISYKSHVQYFYKIVCIDKKHNRKDMMEVEQANSAGGIIADVPTSILFKLRNYKERNPYFIFYYTRKKT
jgi:hypothetical protein